MKQEATKQSGRSGLQRVIRQGQSWKQNITGTKDEQRGNKGVKLGTRPKLDKRQPGAAKRAKLCKVTLTATLTDLCSSGFFFSSFCSQHNDQGFKAVLSCLHIMLSE